MKKIMLALIVVSLITTSCKKNSSGPATVTVKYMSFTPNSSWNYQVLNNLTSLATSYTLTSAGRDSTINSKAYHVFTNSSGSANEYYLLSGSDYYRFQNLPASLSGSAVENIYLKDNAAVNASWSQSYAVTASGIPLNITITNTVTEKGIGKTVNGIAYSGVIHVSSSLSVSVLGVPLPAGAVTSDVQSFYAEKVGLIQSFNKITINYNGIVSNTDNQTSLLSADIK